MKNRERFNRTVKALTDAFFNDTLIALDPCGCAVGNMVAAAQGIKLQRFGSWSVMGVNGDFPNNNEWYNAVNNGEVDYSELYKNPETIQQIEATGYNPEELALIEDAFMMGVLKDEKMYTGSMDQNFDGLMAVVEVLCEIEGVEDPEPTKQLFIIKA